MAYQGLGAVPGDVDDLNIYATGTVDVALREITSQPKECAHSPH
jgi:hypothetical protein